LAPVSSLSAARHRRHGGESKMACVSLLNFSDYGPPKMLDSIQKRSNPCPCAFSVKPQYCHVFLGCVKNRRGCGLDIGIFLTDLNSPLGTTLNYSAIANLQALQITRTR
jgi:hypothetical protein